MVPYTVAFGYQRQGLRVKGREYPLLKMPGRQRAIGFRETDITALIDGAFAE